MDMMYWNINLKYFIHVHKLLITICHKKRGNRWFISQYASVIHTVHINVYNIFTLFRDAGLLSLSTRPPDLHLSFQRPVQPNRIIESRESLDVSNDNNNKHLSNCRVKWFSALGKWRSEIDKASKSLSRLARVFRCVCISNLFVNGSTGMATFIDSPCTQPQLKIIYWKTINIHVRFWHLNT